MAANNSERVKSDPGKITIQSGIHEHEYDDLSKYALMLGGLDVTNPVLKAYDPFKGGFARIFMVRKPAFVDKILPQKMTKFKHLLEYGNVGVTGISDIQLNTASMEGGYANRKMDIPTTAEDGTSELQIKLYEFSGSPVREILHFWITGIADLQSGLTTYHGALDLGVDANQANQTAEFIYCLTDQTGRRPEYVCLFANCFPKSIPMDHLNADGADHSTAPITISFAATKYESKNINEIGVKLLNKYQILTDSLYFNGKITETDLPTGSTHYDLNTGQIASGQGPWKLA